MKFAIFGAGCFWCIEAIFSQLNGVKRVIPGYAGGDKPHPAYEEVCNGDTGYAEVCKIQYDPKIITFEILGIDKVVNISVVAHPLVPAHFTDHSYVVLGVKPANEYGLLVTFTSVIHVEVPPSL